VSFKGHGTGCGMLVVYTVEMLDNLGIGKITLRYITGMLSLGKCGVWN
jgi:hypothetical protein